MIKNVNPLILSVSILFLLIFVVFIFKNMISPDYQDKNISGNNIVIKDDNINNKNIFTNNTESIKCLGKNKKTGEIFSTFYYDGDKFVLHEKIEKDLPVFIDPSSLNIGTGEKKVNFLINGDWKHSWRSGNKNGKKENIVSGNENSGEFIKNYVNYILADTEHYSCVQWEFDNKLLDYLSKINFVDIEHEIESASAIKCEWILSDNSVSYSYFSDGKRVRFDSRSTKTGEGLYIISDDEWSYEWNQKDKVARKKNKFSSDEIKDSRKMAFISSEYSCEKWSVNGDIFKVPGDIKIVKNY